MVATISRFTLLGQPEGWMVTLGRGVRWGMAWHGMAWHGHTKQKLPYCIIPTNGRLPYHTTQYLDLFLA